MKSVQFTGENFNEVVNFCTNGKVKNLVSFELKETKNKLKFIILKTTTNKYQLWDVDFVFMKRNKLFYFQTIKSFQIVENSRKLKTDCEKQEMIPII